MSGFEEPAAGPRGVVLPVDRLLAAYHAVLVPVWLALLPRTPVAAILAAAHLAGLALPALLFRLPPRPSRSMRALRDVYPLIVLAALWPELDMLRQALNLVPYDAAIVALDARLFGTALHQTWIAAMPQRWVSEIMHASYLAYVPLIFVPPLVVLAQGRRAALQDMTFRLMATYLGCFLFYIAFPVDGPYLLSDLYHGPHQDGVFYRLVQATHAVGDSQGASIPSSHVAGAVTIAFLGWRYFPRWVAVFLTVEALGVLVSTTYTQKHYAIDAVAGLAWGVGMQLVGVPALARALAWRRRRLSVEPTATFAPVPARGSGVERR